MPALPPKFTPDPERLAAEEKQAAWKDRKRELQEKLSDARTLLLMKHHFFGRLALKMKLQITEDVSTAAVRADAMCYFNPKLIDGLREDELGFVIAHELMHLALGHFDRQIGKDPHMWNVAGDYVINAMLKRSGLRMPSRADLTPLYDPQFEENSDEQVYHILVAQQKEKEQQQQGGGQGQQQQAGGQVQEQDGQSGGGGQQQQDGQNSGSGGQGGDQDGQGGGGDGPQQEGQRGFGTGGSDCDFGATPDLKRRAEAGTGDRVLSREEWRDEILAAAKSAKSRGQLPAGIERWVHDLRDPKLPWQMILSRYVSHLLKTGCDYRRPARRTASLGHMRGLPRGVRPILPGPTPDRKHVALAIDTSGSMGQDEIRDALSEVHDILKLYNRPVRVMCCDATVHVDEDIREVDDVVVRGGGGTRTEPIFERIDEDPGQWGRPALCIYFSDLMASFPDQEPPYPVLWINTMEREAQKPPFGKVIDLHPDASRGSRSRLLTHNPPRGTR